MKYRAAYLELRWNQQYLQVFLCWCNKSTCVVEILSRLDYCLSLQKFKSLQLGLCWWELQEAIKSYHFSIFTVYLYITVWSQFCVPVWSHTAKSLFLSSDLCIFSILKAKFNHAVIFLLLIMVHPPAMCFFWAEIYKDIMVVFKQSRNFFFISRLSVLCHWTSSLKL